MWPFKKKKPKTTDELVRELEEVEDELYGLDRVFGVISRASPYALDRFERLHVEKRRLQRVIKEREAECTQA